MHLDLCRKKQWKDQSKTNFMKWLLYRREGAGWNERKASGLLWLYTWSYGFKKLFYVTKLYLKGKKGKVESKDGKHWTQERMLASPHKEAWAPSTMLAFLEWNLRSREQGPRKTLTAGPHPQSFWFSGCVSLMVGISGNFPAMMILLIWDHQLREPTYKQVKLNKFEIFP